MSDHTLLLMVIALIAGLGIALVSILFMRIRTADNEIKLKKHRSKDAGLADLLNYAAVVDDGVIVGKNGSFMAGFLYKGEDNASSTDVQREDVSRHINAALKNLGSGWMVHVDAVRRPAVSYSDPDESDFPDLVSEAIDQERRELFQNLGVMYEGYFVITFTWFPPMLAQRKFVEMMFDDDTAKMSRSEQTNHLIDQFKREIETIEHRLSISLDLTRLNGKDSTDEHGVKVRRDQLLSWIQYCVTGNYTNMILPKNPMYIDSYLGGQEFYGGVIPKIGRNFIQTVSIEGFPMESYPGILNVLTELPVEYRWSSRFIFMDQHESLKHLEKFRKKWRQKIRGFFDQVFQTGGGRIDQDASDMVSDADAAIAEINSGAVASGYYTSVVVLMSESREELQSAARQVEKAINRIGFVARTETINTIESYLGSLPGHGVENVRRPLINTLNLADLMPVSSIWTGETQAPCPFYPAESPALMHCVTDGHTPFRLNLHVRDLGHTIMFGPTGMGKSTHISIMAAQLRRYKGMSIFAFDKGMSLYPMTKAVGGDHYNVGGDETDGIELSFCPLQDLSTRSDRAWAMEWIDGILALNGLHTTASQRNDIAIAIQSMSDTGSRTLSDFVMTVQDIEIREALKQYTISGAMGHLLDSEQDGLSLSSFTTFEIEALLELGDKYALPVLLYLFRRIEKSLTGQPAAIILDEAWIMLGHEVFREKIREWLKVMRKANCFVFMATQSLSDAANSGILDVIVESTATKIFLPNPLVKSDEEIEAIYRRMGLNKRQIQIVGNAIPKRQYYYVSEKGRRLYDLALGPLALAFAASSDKESIAYIKQLESQYGSEWVTAWLDHKGINVPALKKQKAA